MANDPIQQNILIALQKIQTALGRRNNTLLSLFRDNAQDPIKWLDDFERAVTANQYNNKYKFQIIGGYFQDSPAIWFSQKTDASVYQRIIRWVPTNAGEENTSFTTHNQKINQTEKQKIYSFKKGLRTDLSYVFWSLLVLKNNPTMLMVIELVQRIKDNQRIHLRFTLPVFVPAPVMASALQMTATSFAVQIQDSNEQLIDRLTLKQLKRINNSKDPDLNPILVSLSSPLTKNSKIMAHLINNNNVSNQKSNHANINFFGENPLVKATGESASQPKKNLFYVFNLTDDDYDMDKLAINTSDLTRKKKKAKVDFVLDLNKASTSTANNNEPPKAKVFKNSSKLESPEIVQKSGPYSVVKNLMKTPAHITFGQKNLHKSLIPKKKTPKTNKCSHQAGLVDNTNVTLLICKAQVAGYFIDLILNNGLSVSIIAKHFLKAIGKKIDESFTQPMTNIHGDKKKGLGIAKAIPVHINGISIETDMEVFKAKEYTIIVGNEWLKKTKALLDYELCELTIKCGEKPIVVKYCHWTTPLVLKQNQEEKQLNESDDDKSDKKKDQKEQEKTAELTYTIFTSNGKPLDNVKADKKGIIINGKLICWSYYNILKRTFDRKPDKKAK
ncbi:hypothetical protein G9A89_010716 [Geosiphon pyriformis]|nr:hypothetical protein G9A89_010716 [Geosiphon pyriformis]